MRAGYPIAGDLIQQCWPPLCRWHVLHTPDGVALAYGPDLNHIPLSADRERAS